MLAVCARRCCEAILEQLYSVRSASSGHVACVPELQAAARVRAAALSAVLQLSALQAPSPSGVAASSNASSIRTITTSTCGSHASPQSGGGAAAAAAGATAPRRRGRVSSLPATTTAAPAASPAALRLAGELAVPPAYAQHMLDRAPYLANHPPKLLAARAAALAAVLTPARTTAAAAAAAAADRHVPRVPRSVLYHNPHLLVQEPAAWEAAIDDLASGLGLPRDRIVRMCRLHPALLYQSPGRVTDNVKALGRLLGVDAVAAVRMVVGFPTLALQTRATLTERLARLTNALDPLPRAQVARLVAATPHILALDPARVAARCEAWDAAAEGTGLVGAWKAYGRVLALSEDVTTRRLQLMRRLARRHAAWGEWLRDSRGGAPLVLHSDARWERVEYLLVHLQDTGGAAALSDSSSSGSSGSSGGNAGGSSSSSTAGSEGGSAAGSSAAGDGGSSFLNNPPNLRRILYAWSDSEFEAQAPGFAAWRAARAAATRAEASRKKPAVTGTGTSRRQATKANPD